MCSPGEWTIDAHGSLPSCVEIKLVDFPDAGYYATNVPNPQGEIWIRGPSVTKRYYENERETAEVITPDGWFKTGDIGEWKKNGHLKVIDRKKNLVKTLNGEYIALEKVSSPGIPSIEHTLMIIARIRLPLSNNRFQHLHLCLRYRDETHRHSGPGRACTEETCRSAASRRSWDG